MRNIFPALLIYRLYVSENTVIIVSNKFELLMLLQSGALSSVSLAGFEPAASTVQNEKIAVFYV